MGLILVAVNFRPKNAVSFNKRLLLKLSCFSEMLKLATYGVYFMWQFGFATVCPL